MIAALVLPFVNEDKTLGFMLRMDRHSNQVLRRLIYQCALLGCEKTNLINKRKAIWYNILDVPKLKKSVDPYEVQK
jgi:3-methyladenine DNA glycosylase AlkC